MDSHLAAPSGAQSAHGPATSVQSIQTQTMEWSPEPCDVCERAQASLREVGRGIINICNSQNLPSSLSRFLELAGDAPDTKPLRAMDVSYWATEQSKDLSRINKHLRTLVELINPLKGALEESEKQREELRDQLETLEGRLQKEKEAQEQERKEAERLFERKHAESLQQAASLEKEKKELQNRVDSLEGNLSRLKETLRAQEGTIQALEEAKKGLLQEMKAKMMDRDEVQKLEDRLQAQASQLESARQQLDRANVALEKERAKADSMLRHKESLQAKQRALMQQLDGLDQECEQLKASLADGEEEQQMMRERLKETQEEKRGVQQQLEVQQKLTERAQHEKQTVEQSAAELQRTISELGELIEEMKEKQRLLVFFPDLHVPVEAQFESTGDVMEDMGKQLQANNIRISILEEENARLRTALTKMKEVTQLEGPKLVPPAQLWIQPPAKATSEDGERQPPVWYPGGRGSQGAPASHSSPNRASLGSAGQNRARSGHALARDGSASRRPPSEGKRAKPPSGQASRKAAFHFSGEEGSGLGAFARAQGRDQVLGHPAHGAWSHQK
nr:coiled-coil domain-containing protein 157-like [Pogona vitticeps]